MSLRPLGLTMKWHRSRQATAELLEPLDLIVVVEVAHLNWVRQQIPSVATKTTTLWHLQQLDFTCGAEFLEKIGALGLADRHATDDVDVEDPGGKEQPAYDACAQEIFSALASISPRLDLRRSDGTDPTELIRQN